MAKYDAEIKDVKKALTEKDVRRKEWRSRLGKALLSLQPEGLQGSSLEEVYQEASALQEELPGDLDRRETFIGKLEKFEAHKEKASDLKQSLKSLHKEADPYFEDLGRAVYDLHRRGVFLGEGLSEEIKQVEHKDAELKQLEGSIQQNRNTEGEKNFFGKVVGKGRELVLTTNRSSKMASLLRHFKSLGELAARGGGLDKVADAGFTDAADPLLSLRDKEEALSRQVEDLEKRRDKAWQALEAMGSEGKPRKALKELTRLIDEKKEKLEELVLSLGKGFEESPLEETAREETLKNHLDQLSRIRDGKALLEAHLDRLHAGQEVVRLEKQIGEGEKKLTRLEKEKADLEAKMEALRQDLADKARAKESGEKRRGAAEDLEDLPSDETSGEE